MNQPTKPEPGAQDEMRAAFEKWTSGKSFVRHVRGIEVGLRDYASEVWTDAWQACAQWQASRAAPSDLHAAILALRSSSGWPSDEEKIFNSGVEAAAELVANAAPAQNAAGVPFGWRDVIEHIRDHICAGGLAENAQHERSVVEPYLDNVIDALEELEADATKEPK